MNILCLGDVVGSAGCEFVSKHLPDVKKLKSIDLTIANGENSSDGNGITPASANQLFSSGVDIITTGNHTFRRKEIYDFLDENEFILRPANFPDGTTPGSGMKIFDMGRWQVCVINIMGTAFMEPLACPFETAEKLLKEVPDNVKVIIVDFHAEATGEKGALAWHLDGKISALFGTHTHVLTADERILPNGTGFITDIGMAGAIDSILGVEPKLIIEKMKNKLPVRFSNASGCCKMSGVIFEVDPASGRCLSVERMEIKDN